MECAACVLLIGVHTGQSGIVSVRAPHSHSVERRVLSLLRVHFEQVPGVSKLTGVCNRGVLDTIVEHSAGILCILLD